jgi:predicted DNA-binding transcriptional regulator AlpA
MKFVPFENLREFGITVSKVSIWRWERAGQFPKRVQVSPGRHAWVESEVRQWVSDRIAARDATAVAA